jgi:hypothetical protein
MSTMASVQSGASNNWFGNFLKLIAIAMIVVFGCWLFSVCQHALDKHGEDALLVEQCLNQKGPQWGIWQRKSDGHLALPCLVDDGKWGIKIDKCDGENCTALIKEKMKRGWQIIKYLQNRGYEAVDDVAKAFIEKNPIPNELLNDW